MPAIHQVNLPLRDKKLLDSIKLEDRIHINGYIVTARDMAHKYFIEEKEKVSDLINMLKSYLNKGALYHCGPIMNLKTKKVLSAGPTTSSREEPYMEKVIALFDLSMIIGKGGMGEKTLKALEKNKTIYLNAIGGAGSFYAKKLEFVDVFMLKEFGMPEAIWIFKARDFPVVATMDFRCNSIYQKIEDLSRNKLKDLYIK